jgi:hypothetical protein
MQIIDFSRDHARPIELFDAVAASNVRIGGGQGETHVYCVYFKPGGSIGEHPAGYAQLFLIVDGEGWTAGADGIECLPGRPGRTLRRANRTRRKRDGDDGDMVQSEQLTTEPLK